MRDEIHAFNQDTATRRAPRTVSSYAAVLAALEVFLDANGKAWPPPRSDIEAFHARPARNGERRAPATRNQELAALRALGKFGVQKLGWAADPSASIPFEREPSRHPAVLTVFEVSRLFTAADEGERGADRSRLLAILAVLSQIGLRVHELVALDVDQIDTASTTLISVKGKGGSVHDLPLNSQTITLLTAWLRDRIRIAKPNEPALFVSARGTRISIRTVERMLEKLRKAIGTRKHVTPHTLRHSCATISLTNGVDLSTVADLLRHTDVNVTRKYYLHLVDERRREAVGRLAATIPPAVLPQLSGIPGVASGGTWATKDLDDQHGLDAMPRAA